MSNVDATGMILEFSLSNEGERFETLENFALDGVSPSVFRRAARQMETKNFTAARQFVGWVQERFGVVGERGRPGPTNGSSSSYTTQQNGKGRPYLLIPVGTLGAKRGEDVRVRFLDGEIVLG